MKIRKIVFFFMIALLLIPSTSIFAEAETSANGNDILFSVPMNSFCDLSHEVSMSINLTNVSDVQSDIIVQLFKLDGTELAETGLNSNGILNTISPGTSMTLNPSQTALFNYSFGGFQNNCSDRVYYGKITVSEDTGGTIVASGWVTGTNGNSTIVINGGQPFVASVKEALEVIETDPANLETDVRVDKTVRITFNKNIVQGSQFDEITMLAYTPITAEPMTVTGSVYISNNMLVIDPGYNIYHESTFVINIPTNAVIGENGETLRDSYSISFETIQYEDTEDITPTMTGFTTPSGAVTSSSEPDPGQSSPGQGLKSSYRAFDDDMSPGKHWLTKTNVTSAWIAYEFGSSKTVRQYTITPHNGNWAPKNWTFEGYNGTNWVVLDTRTNVTNWNFSSKKVFHFSNSTAFKKYRLNIASNNGGSNIAINEIELME